ncbi:MAG: ABC transporter permease [Schleiferiaceae bacterium]|jgi:peptide/nickel transport system permease protein
MSLRATLTALWRHPLGRLGTVVLAAWILLAVFAYAISADPSPWANAMNLGERAQAPGYISADGIRHWLGTDRYGRDVTGRLLLGGRVSLSVGFIAVGIAMLVGIPVGAWAGYYGGRVDAALSALIQVFWSIPSLLMVMALSFVLGKGFWQVFVAVGLTSWVEVARLVRGQVIAWKPAEFVQAARVLGYPDRRILWKHIMPQAVAPLIVLAASQFASAILLESGLSFLGLGAQPPMPSWGGMIRDHYAYLLTGQAHLALIPGAALATLVLAFQVLGTALRDVLDVRK